METDNHIVESKLSPEQSKEITLKSWTSQILFLIALISVVAGFFKVLNDAKESMDTKLNLVQKSVDDSFRDMGKDMKADYATKEEMRFVKDALIEMKGDIKETKGKIDTGLQQQNSRGRN